MNRHALSGLVGLGLVSAGCAMTRSKMETATPVSMEKPLERIETAINANPYRTVNGQPPKHMLAGLQPRVDADMPTGLKHIPAENRAPAVMIADKRPAKPAGAANDAGSQPKDSAARTAALAPAVAVNPPQTDQAAAPQSQAPAIAMSHDETPAPTTVLAETTPPPSGSAPAPASAAAPAAAGPEMAAIASTPAAAPVADPPGSADAPTAPAPKSAADPALGVGIAADVMPQALFDEKPAAPGPVTAPPDASASAGGTTTAAAPAKPATESELPPAVGGGPGSTTDTGPAALPDLFPPEIMAMTREKAGAQAGPAQVPIGPAAGMPEVDPNASASAAAEPPPAIAAGPAEAGDPGLPRIPEGVTLGDPLRPSLGQADGGRDASLKQADSGAASISQGNDLPPLPASIPIDPPSAVPPSAPQDSPAAPVKTDNTAELADEDLPPLPAIDLPPLPPLPVDKAKPAEPETAAADLPPIEPVTTNPGPPAREVAPVVKPESDLPPIPPPLGEPNPSPSPALDGPETSSRSPMHNDAAVQRASFSSPIPNELPPAPPPLELDGEGNATLVKVGEEVITRNDLRDAYRDFVRRIQAAQPGATEQQINTIKRENLPRILRNLVVQQMLAQEAMRVIKQPKLLDRLNEEADGLWRERVLPDLIRKDKLTNEIDLKKKMSERGESLDAMRTAFRRDFLANQFVATRLRGRVKPTLADELAYYNEHLAKFDQPEQVTWREIAIDIAKFPDRDSAQRKVEEIVSRLAKGEDFSAIAQAESSGATATEGGLWKDTAPGGFMVKGVNEAIASLKPGQSSRVIEGPRSFHIVRIESRRAAGPLPFKEVQTEVEGKLISEKNEEEFQALLGDIRKRIPVVPDILAETSNLSRR